jgi:hypothetical protein
MRAAGDMEACPTDEELAAFIEQGLAEDMRDRVERHVAVCPTCVDVVAAALPPAAAAAPAIAPVRRDRAGATGRSWTRWAMAAGVLLVGGGLVVGALQGPVLGRLGSGLTGIAARFLGTPLRADTFQVRLGDTPGTFVVMLREVQIGRELGMFATAEEVGMTVALAAPVFGEPVVAAMHVVGPVVELAGPGSLSLAWPASERAKVFALLGQASRVDVAEGRVLLRGPSGNLLAIDHVIGGIERTADGARIALQGQTARGEVDVVGTLGREDRSVALTISGRALDLAAMPLLTHRLVGSADVRIEMTSKGDELRADGRIAVRNGRLIGQGPTRVLPLDAETTATLAGIAPDLAGADLAFEDARAVFALRHGTWRLPRVFVTTRAAIAGGRARVDAHGTVTGHGTLRLPPDLVSGLESAEPGLAVFRDATGAATLAFGVDGTLDAPRFSLGRP